MVEVTSGSSSFLIGTPGVTTTRAVVYSSGTLSLGADANAILAATDFTSVYGTNSLLAGATGVVSLAAQGGLYAVNTNSGAVSVFGVDAVVARSPGDVSLYGGANFYAASSGAALSMSSGTLTGAALAVSLSGSTGGVFLQSAASSVYARAGTHAVVETGASLSLFSGTQTSLVSGLSMGLSGAADAYLQSPGTAALGGTSGLVSVWGANSVGITAGASPATGNMLLSAGGMLSAYGGSSLVLTVADSAGSASIFAPAAVRLKSTSDVTLVAGAAVSAYGQQKLALLSDDTAWFGTRNAASPFAVNGVLSFHDTGAFDLLGTMAGAVSAASVSVLGSADVALQGATGMAFVRAAQGVEITSTGAPSAAGGAGISLYSGSNIFATTEAANSIISLYSAAADVNIFAGRNAIMQGGVAASVTGATSVAIQAGPGVWPATTMSRIDLIGGAISATTSTTIALTANADGSWDTAKLLVGGTDGKGIYGYSEGLTSLNANVAVLRSGDFTSLFGANSLSHVSGGNIVLRSTATAGVVSVTGTSLYFGSSAVYNEASSTGGGMVRFPTTGVYFSARGAPNLCGRTIESGVFFKSSIFIIPQTCATSGEIYTLPAPTEEGQVVTVICALRCSARSRCACAHNFLTPTTVPPPPSLLSSLRRGSPARKYERDHEQLDLPRVDVTDCDEWGPAHLFGEDLSQDGVQGRIVPIVRRYVRRRRSVWRVPRRLLRVGSRRRDDHGQHVICGDRVRLSTAPNK